MKKIVYPKFEKCKPLPKAVLLEDKTFKLELDLKNAFHRGYIDRHGIAPANGKNPFLSEYEELIDPSEEFRFIKPGIANDDEGKKGESNKLGRAIALGILSEFYNYTWFPSISNLMRKPENGWSASRKNKGNSPDWLIGNSTEFAVAEAKGTHSKILIDSPKVESWRTQVQNVTIHHNGVETSLKTWIIASRFVTVDKPADRPDILIEDPVLPGRPLNQDNTFSFGRWIAKTHVLNNLARINHYELILRINERSMRKTKVLVWRCTHPSLDHLRFIGNPLSMQHINHLPFFAWEEFLFHGTTKVHERMQFWFQTFFGHGFFDGIELSVISALIGNNIPEPVNTNEYSLVDYDFISLLSDGSFLAPMSLMQPEEIIEI